jgi:hypothetical protein
MREPPEKVAVETIESGVFAVHHPDVVMTMRPPSYNPTRSVTGTQVATLRTGRSIALFLSRAIPRTTEFPQDAVS